MLEEIGQAAADGLYDAVLWLDKHWYRWVAAVLLFGSVEIGLIVLTT